MKETEGRWFPPGRGAEPSAAMTAADIRRRSVAGGDDQRLFERGDAFADFFERDHAERFHSQRDGDLADFVRAGPLNDEPADVVGHAHGFNDGQASGVTGIFAPIATATAKQSGPLEKAGV